METKNPSELLIAALADFEEHSDPTQKKDAILPLQRFAKQLEVRSWELQEQRWRLTAAESAGDKDTLRALQEHSQHEQIREWCAEVLGTSKTRVLAYQTLQM